MGLSCCSLLGAGTEYFQAEVRRIQAPAAAMVWRMSLTVDGDADGTVVVVP